MKYLHMLEKIDIRTLQKGHMLTIKTPAGDSINIVLEALPTLKKNATEAEGDEYQKPGGNK